MPGSYRRLIRNLRKQQELLDALPAPGTRVMLCGFHHCRGQEGTLIGVEDTIVGKLVRVHLGDGRVTFIRNAGEWTVI